MVRVMDDSESAATSELVITAFLEGDSWYKKPDCVERLNGDRSGNTLVGMIGKTIDCMLVAEAEDGELVGAIGVVYSDDGPAHLTMVSVPARNGRKGIGKSLVKAAEELAAKHGKREVSMMQ